MTTRALRTSLLPPLSTAQGAREILGENGPLAATTLEDWLRPGTGPHGPDGTWLVPPARPFNGFDDIPGDPMWVAEDLERFYGEFGYRRPAAVGSAGPEFERTRRQWRTLRLPELCTVKGAVAILRLSDPALSQNTLHRWMRPGSGRGCGFRPDDSWMVPAVRPFNGVSAKPGQSLWVREDVEWFAENVGRMGSARKAAKR